MIGTILDFFGILGIIVAVVVWFAVTAILTEIFKKKTKHPLLLSWGIGLTIYSIGFIFKIQELNLKSVLLFMLLTGILNGSYRAKFTGLKTFLRKIIK